MKTVRILLLTILVSCLMVSCNNGSTDNGSQSNSSSYGGSSQSNSNSGNGEGTVEFTTPEGKYAVTLYKNHTLSARVRDSHQTFDGEWTLYSDWMTHGHNVIEVVINSSDNVITNEKYYLNLDDNYFYKSQYSASTGFEEYRIGRIFD